MGGGRRKKSIGTDVGKCEVEKGAGECASGAWGRVVVKSEVGGSGEVVPKFIWVNQSSGTKSGARCRDSHSKKCFLACQKPYTKPATTSSTLLSKAVPPPL